jgi:hypothetical protein
MIIMINLHSITRLLSIFFLSLVFVALTSCGTGDPLGSSDTAQGSGTVALLVTDAPSDIFEEINITVTKAELLSENGRVTVFEGERTFNLLELTDARIFAIREGVPAGSYNKIRLTLSDIELVDYMGTDDPADDAIYHPSLPGNGKLDLNPRGSFDVVAGGTLTIQIDMDANKSIHIVKNGNKDEYQFRPVVFIDIITDDFVERYVKLHGDIEAINTTDQSFKLCNTNIPVQIGEGLIDDSNHGCVRVEASDNTSIFDSNGQPAVFADLLDYEEATVFGRLQHDDDNDSVEATDIDDDRELDDLVLKAALIELGPVIAFQKLNGTATSPVDSSNVFTMDVDAGQGYTTPLTLNIQIQDGTILINRNGEPVAISDITNGKLVAVRGVIDAVTDTLYASLIVVDTDSSTKLTGTVGANPDSVCGFTIVTADGDRSVRTDSSTRVFLIEDGSSSPISVSALSTDQNADVYGNYANGCFDAHTIIAY